MYVMRAQDPYKRFNSAYMHMDPSTDLHAAAAALDGMVVGDGYMVQVEAARSRADARAKENQDSMEQPCQLCGMWTMSFCERCTPTRWLPLPSAEFAIVKAWSVQAVNPVPTRSCQQWFPHRDHGCFIKGILAAPPKATPTRNKGLIRPF